MTLPHKTVAQPPAPSRGLRTRLLDRFFVTGEILDTEQIAARMRRIRIAGTTLRGLDYAPGQQVRVTMGEHDASGLLARIGDLRTYSVWWYDSDTGTLDLCVLDHGDGPGAEWGRTATPGQPVRFRAPEGSFTLRPDAPYHLFAGEETASVAFGAILRAVPEHIPVHGIVETATAADLLPLPRVGALRQVLRGDATAARSELLLAALTDLELPDTPGVAYLAGEARTIQLLARHLVRDRGWPRRAVLTKPFWTPGRRGLD